MDLELEPVVEFLTLSVRGTEVYLTGAWPRRTVVDDAWIHQSPAVFRLRWPYLTIVFANTRATYRVETCERGHWLADRVEMAPLGIA